MFEILRPNRSYYFDNIVTPSAARQKGKLGMKWRLYLWYFIVTLSVVVQKSAHWFAVCTFRGNKICDCSQRVIWYVKKIRNVIRPYRITCFCLNCFFFDRWCEKKLFESFAVIFVKENLQKCWLMYKSLCNCWKIKSINLNFENCTRHSLIKVGV